MRSGPLCIFASKISRVYLKLSGLGQSRTFLWNKMGVLRWPGSKYSGESKDFISSCLRQDRYRLESGPDSFRHSVLKSIAQWQWASLCCQSPESLFSDLLLLPSLSDAQQSFWDLSSLSSWEFPSLLSFLHLLLS